MALHVLSKRPHSVRPFGAIDHASSLYFAREWTVDLEIGLDMKVERKGTVGPPWKSKLVDTSGRISILVNEAYLPFRNNSMYSTKT
jgi:hypothetical protein